jgi:pimeloyl-ACP methyl ester carboxylesterase
VEKIIDSLVNPADPTQQAYHVVAPSLPGFGFSSSSKSPDFTLRDIATINNKIMLALGYTKYIVQGGDWGSMVSRFAAVVHPENVLACHVNMFAATPPKWYRNPISFVRFMLWAILTAKKPGTMLARALWWREHENGRTPPLLQPGYRGETLSVP